MQYGSILSDKSCWLPWSLESSESWIAMYDTCFTSIPKILWDQWLENWIVFNLLNYKASTRFHWHDKCLKRQLHTRVIDELKFQIETKEQNKVYVLGKDLFFAIVTWNIFVSFITQTTNFNSRSLPYSVALLATSVVIVAQMLHIWHQQMYDLGLRTGTEVGV